MSQEYLYLILLFLTGILGFAGGCVVVLFAFARDKTITRITENDVIVKKQDLENMKRKNFSYGDDN